jgi:segregation and condensation protein B
MTPKKRNNAAAAEPAGEQDTPPQPGEQSGPMPEETPAGQPADGDCVTGDNAPEPVVPDGEAAESPDSVVEAGEPEPAGSVQPASEPAPEEQQDPVLASLEELDRQAKETGGALELVEQLEFATVPKGRRGAAKGEERDAPLDLASVAEARAVIEAYLFTTNEPLTVARISKLMNNLHPRTVRGLLLELQMEYDRRAGALQIIEVAGGFQMATRPQQSEWVLRLHRQRRRSTLSPATLETLAIIAYKQPVTKAEIEVIRGVETTAPLHTLLDLGLIEVGGRREVIGRPQLYVTTDLFLKTFGLRSLADLPSILELKHLFAEEQRLRVKPAEPAATAPAEDGPAEGDAPSEPEDPAVGESAATDEPDDSDAVESGDAVEAVELETEAVVEIADDDAEAALADERLTEVVEEPGPDSDGGPVGRD